MKLQDYNYDVYPKVLKVGQQATVTVRPKYDHISLKDDHKYSMILSERDTYVKGDIDMAIDNGAIKVTFTPTMEQEYTLVLTDSVEGGRTVKTEFCLYAVEADLFAYRPWKGDFHIHSCRSDGRESPVYVASNYRRHGFDFFALTDHHRYGPSQEVIEAFKKLETNFKVYPGEEVHPPRNCVHQVNFGGAFSVNDLHRQTEQYEKEVARLGLTHSDLFIEDGTLYLSHHGIRGQRWGVRRFQNRDGSLTNAGRKRLGYATKGAAQTVSKAFKAGVKAGGNAVKAVKAHHEKKEAEKLQKKKEKASKTRLGVMANKDLFTNEEIRKLNERFKLEDEMKMATLQKGVEIAKAVGVIAQNVGTVAKAYEDVTGTSLSPIKKAKQEAEAKEKAEDRKRKLAKEDAETKRAEDKEKRDIEDRERRIKFEDEDRVRKQAKEDADAQRAENAEKRAQAKEQRDSSMAVELQRKAKAAADEQEHKAVKAKAESKSAILDVLDKINKIQDHDDDDDDHNNPPGGGVDTWDDDDYLNFFKKTGIIHSDISDPSLIQNGILFVDSSDGFAHHGVKGQRWGVRRFQNADGSLTEKGRKHYEKAIAKLDRKQVNSDNRRGRLERQHPFAVTASAILTGSAYAALMVASAANPAMVVAGSAIAAAVSALGTHVDYSVAEAWEGRGTKRRQKKRKEYEEMLNHDGMYHVKNGTLFIDAGEPYLEHHGVLGMKWGKHLRAGKGPIDGEAGGGGGSGEDDEKLKEMAKKAGMSVAEYRTKMAGKLSGAASKVGSAVYDAAGGSHKTEAAAYRREAQKQNAEEQYQKARANKLKAASASEKRKAQKLLDSGDNGGYVNASINSKNWKSSADTADSKARDASKRREKAQKTANEEQSKYEKSLAGKYDKMKADRARKKSAKEKKRLLTQTSAEAKRISVKDKHLVINGNRSGGTRSLAVGETGEKPKSFKEKAYDALGGKYKTQAADAHREMIQKRNDADDKARRANAQGRAANANKKAGNVREYMANKEGARQLDAEAKGARTSQWEATKKANRAQWKYDHSIAGLYDKATGKYKQAHKKTAIPKMMDRWKYEYKDGPNSKLFNNGKGKAKTTKEHAKAEVWNAADHQIKAKEYNDVANSLGGNANYYGQAYKNAAAKEARLAEGSYRRAAALGKQTSSETSTSSRPRARKKKHTSGGSGVTVRRPGRKPVSRTKRVTQSSTGVKRHGATGTGARVRRGA